jgi:hypothetical protein
MLISILGLILTTVTGTFAQSTPEGAMTRHRNRLCTPYTHATPEAAQLDLLGSYESQDHLVGLAHSEATEINASLSEISIRSQTRGRPRRTLYSACGMVSVVLIR